MIVLFALSNPSPQYNFTRHNAGHYVLSKIKSFVSIKKFNDLQNSTIFSFECNGSSGFFAFSKTYMNASGKAFEEVLNQVPVKLDHVCVFHDDMDVSLGRFKLTFSGGSAGHKGVESIISVIGDDKFWRLKIGISKNFVKADRTSWLLSKFSPFELEKLDQTIENLQDAFKELFLGNFLKAQNKFNRFSLPLS